VSSAKLIDKAAERDAQGVGYPVQVSSELRV
jgi:hypothetical protein